MSGAGRASRLRAAWAGLLLALPGLWACAGPLVEVDGGFRHARHGYRIGVPPPAWERVDVEGSVLAYRRPGPLWMTLSSRCKLPLTRPQILARHLRIGLPPHTLRESGPVELGDLQGWEQVFDTRDGDHVVRVKTVTIVARPCALDWLLTARGGVGFEAAELDLDAWWHTLEVDPVAAPEAGGATP